MTVNGREPVSVKEAAEVLGITDRAVRLRIQKGTLRGMVIKGKWLVYLNAEVPEAMEALEDFHSSVGRVESESEGPTSNAELQLQMVMSSWVQPLVDQIGRLEREVGRLEAAQSQAERTREDAAATQELVARERGENAALRERLAQAERERDALAQALGGIETADEAAPRGFWQRLFGS